ncbi:uncharacterized protein LOC132552550 [Ylistrum balloti]|uniref:uncharacterized protein LOC132552550 n=1 Tax=Ylistrum balloti TaxID=509963 RepID=UPI002905C057|nr:uncharacterized protein LOC132552550 [Ylistrum balloti]
MKDITAQLENCDDIIVNDAETSTSLDSPVDWCGAHGVRYNEDFRNVVYKINPNHLSCGYKKMFEASATSSLRGMEQDVEDENDKELNKKMKDETNTWATTVRQHTQGSCASSHKYKFDSPPPHRGQAQIIQSLSSAYTSSPGKTVTKKEFRGWDVCSRPHSADSSGYLKFTSAETRDMMRNRSQSACVKNGMKREKVFMSKVQINGPPRAQSTLVRTSMDMFENRDTVQSKLHLDHPLRAQSSGGKFYGDVADRTMESQSHTSTGSSNHSIPVPCPYVVGSTNSADVISYEFEHFLLPNEHTKKYREDYTYRKLEIARSLASGSSVLRMNIPSSCIPITVPVFMSPNTECNKCKTPVDTTPNRSPSPVPSPTPHEKPEDTKIAVNCKKAVLKKRLSKPPVPEMGRKVPHYLLANNGTLKMDYYNNPLTFDIPENDKTVNKPPSPIVCRTRPTIPSNAHGNIYPSSTDTHSYVIRRRKGIQ